MSVHPAVSTSRSFNPHPGVLFLESGINANADLLGKHKQEKNKTRHVVILHPLSSSTRHIKSGSRNHLAGELTSLG